MLNLERKKSLSSIIKLLGFSSLRLLTFSSLFCVQGGTSDKILEKDIISLNNFRVGFRNLR